jgi:hypothetical protein
MTRLDRTPAIGLCLSNKKATLKVAFLFSKLLAAKDLVLLALAEPVEEKLLVRFVELGLKLVEQD